jgi:hypothetical protein
MGRPVISRPRRRASATCRGKRASRGEKDRALFCRIWAVAFFVPTKGGTTMRKASSTWSDDETSVLIELWTTHSATQIARRLNRTRSQVCAKARRLKLAGMPAHLYKNFAVDPMPTRRSSRHRSSWLVRLAALIRLRGAGFGYLDAQPAPCAASELFSARPTQIPAGW